jgi:hypothetical protein
MEDATGAVTGARRLEILTRHAGRGLALTDVPLTVGQDNQVSPEVTDEALSEAFRRYHAAVARLDFVKNTVNLAQASRHHLKAGRISL